MANVVITGTSRGIGFELCRIFAERGDRVWALSRNTGPLEAANLKGVEVIPFDISSAQDIAKFATDLSKVDISLDILINNAGRLINKPFTQTSWDDFQEVYAVNVFGLAELTRSLIPLMKKSAHVVTISSMGGVQGSSKFPGLAAYSSSKGAIITLSELLAEEYKETGPAFNVLALGAVQTEMLEEAFPGYQAPTTAAEMAEYIASFALEGHLMYNGKVLPVSNSTP
ncbi:MAG: SDR family oxidoreductase [Flavobacteriaceae bacterium]|nr:SDR family oxidoreductase [Flavobacteriaceae bacterium]